MTGEPTGDCGELRAGDPCADGEGQCEEGLCVKYYTEGHADLSVQVTSESSSLHVSLRSSGLPRARIGGELALDQSEFDLNEVTIVVTNKFFERPNLEAFSPLCVEPNESVAWLSQGNDSLNGQPFLGFEVNASPEILPDGGVTLRLVAIDGPGAHSFWKDAFPPAFFFSSCDGIGPKDQLFLPNGHDHFNLEFAGGLGLFRLTYEIQASVEIPGSTAQIAAHIFRVFVLVR